MKWQVTVQPASPANLRLTEHLILDPDLSLDASDQAYIGDLASAAVEYAETVMQMSLEPRTITAIFNMGEDLELPRGPVIAVSSVTDANGNSLTGFSVQTSGNVDKLIVLNGFTAPLTVVYTAGYPNGTPADIRQAIRVHVATMYEERQLTTDRPANQIPHSLEQFYQRKSRGLVVG